MKTLLIVFVSLLFAPVTVYAQLPAVPVLGVGYLWFEVAAPASTANEQIYYIYLDDRPKQRITVTCAELPNPDAVIKSFCSTPLAPLKLTANHTAAITVARVAADGELEGPRAALPFSFTTPPMPVGITPASAIVKRDQVPPSL